jgi:hypothetical protein
MLFTLSREADEHKFWSGRNFPSYRIPETNLKIKTQKLFLVFIGVTLGYFRSIFTTKILYAFFTSPMHDVGKQNISKRTSFVKKICKCDF